MTEQRGQFVPIRGAQAVCQATPRTIPNLA